MTTNEDASLVLAAKKDLRKFSAIYEKYFPMVYRYFISRTGNTLTSEDLTSETFMKILTHIKSYKITKSSFKSWVFTIARNTMVDMYKQKVKITTDLDDIQEQQSDEDVEQRAHNTLQYEKITEILFSFSEDEKEIILLKLVSDLTFSEISKLVDMNENSVKSKYFRSLKNLMKKASIFKLLYLLILIK